MKPDGECLRASEWFVGDCEPNVARRLVEEHHYAAGASNTATYVHGLYREAGWGMVGVTWWIPPTRGAAGAAWPVPGEVLALSRMVVLPGAPKNSATFLLARSSRMVGPRWRCLLTYADTWRGHDGTIYRAAGWEYLGLTRPEPVYVIGGRMVSRKCGPTTRTHAEMLAMGCEFLGRFPKHRYRKVMAAVARRPRPVYHQMQFGGEEVTP